MLWNESFAQTGIIEVIEWYLQIIPEVIFYL
jgi:hypothetical protein